MQGTLTFDEVCKLFRITRPTLYKRLKEIDDFPKPVQFSERGRLYWFVKDIEEYMERFSNDSN